MAEEVLTPQQGDPCKKASWGSTRFNPCSGAQTGGCLGLTDQPVYSKEQSGQCLRKEPEG